MPREIKESFFWQTMVADLDHRVLHPDLKIGRCRGHPHVAGLLGPLMEPSPTGNNAGMHVPVCGSMQAQTRVPSHGNYHTRPLCVPIYAEQKIMKKIELPLECDFLRPSMFLGPTDIGDKQ
jgi:hypothetical protein